MLFTVGHSTHTLEDFLTLLREAKVKHVVDVRSLPGSTRFPHFNAEELSKSLPEAGFVYTLEKKLGGLRRKTPGIPKDTNGMWRNDSFHRYADYALTEDFDEGLKSLLDLMATENVAVMCAEAVWWRCHRRIIADHVLARNLPVKHIMPGGKIVAAQLTDGAVISPTTKQVTYPQSSEEV